MRVLVAEDDEGLRDVLVLGLSDAGYQVDAVDSRGDDAIDQLKWYDYDVAIIDWRMPGAEGIEVVAWARRNDRPTALLMLTARDAPADRIRGLDTGADDYLVKPFDFGELLARSERSSGGRAASTRRLERADSPWIRQPGRERRRQSLNLTGDRVPHPRAAHAPLAGRRRSQVDRRARLGDETDPLGSNAIDVQLSRLRAKLPDAGIRIVTVRGAGYRLEELTAARPPRPASVHPRRARRRPRSSPGSTSSVAIAVVASSTGNLTAQIDQRLSRFASAPAAS